MTIRKPDIIWKGDPAIKFGYPNQGNHGRLGQKVLAIVNHVMEGTLIGTDQHFRNPSTMASTHFGIGRNGEIWQWVDLNDAAWGNGDVKNHTWPLMPVKGISPNLVTVSIEHEGYTGKPFTPEQLASSKMLNAWLCQIFNIVPGDDTIIGHNRINSVDRPFCPGNTYSFREVINYCVDALKDAEGDIAQWKVTFNQLLMTMGLVHELRHPVAEVQFWELGAILQRFQEQHNKQVAELTKRIEALKEQLNTVNLTGAVRYGESVRIERSDLK